MKAPRSQQFFAAFVLLLVLRLLAGSAYRGAIVTVGLPGTDFSIIHAAALRMEKHEPLYLPEDHTVLRCQFTCSPFVPTLLRPLAHLPPQRAGAAWAAINTGLLVLCVALFCASAGIQPLVHVPAALFVLISAFRFWPTVMELFQENTHILLLTCVCGMLLCARRQNWIALAVLIAVAALIKTWMIGMIFFLLAIRRWRLAVLSVVMFLGGIALFSISPGWQNLRGFLMVTWAYRHEPFFSHSVNGMAHLFFARNDDITPITESFWAWALAMILGYGTLIAGLVMMFIRGPRMDAAQRQLSIGLAAVALVLGCPTSHIHYFPLVLPLLWSITCAPLNQKSPGLVIVLAFVAYLFMSFPSSPSTSPVPESWRHGIRTVAVAQIFVPTMTLWLIGVGIACRSIPAGEALRKKVDDNSVSANMADALQLEEEGAI